MSTRDRTTVIRVALLADTLLGGGGMGRYAREVLAGLARRDDVEIVPVVPADAVSLAERLGASRVVDIETIRGPTVVGQGLWERHLLGRLASKRGCHVVHGVKHLVPKTRIPTVLTVHDLMPLTSRQQFTIVKRLLLPAQYRRSIEEATLLVAVSNATRRRLAQVLPEVDAKTVVVENGVGRSLLLAEPRSVPALDGTDFALVVGDLSPRKNVSLLLDVWDRIHHTTGLVLAVVGPDGWRSRETRRRLDDAVARRIASRYADLDDAALRWCYEHARVVLCPSLEEGYGLPVAEALAFGAPVVAGTDDALVEVGRGQAHHVDPLDAARWQAAIEALVAEPRRRQPVVPPTWDDHVAGLVEAYRRALATT